MPDGTLVSVPGPAGALEGRWHPSPDGVVPRGGAVMAHPHPLMGGTMANPVVVRVTRALAAAGVSTLRFNFREVGASDGTHGAGATEAGDVGAALTWVAAQHPDLPLIAAGYSFGALMAGRWVPTDGRVAAIVAIGFPLTMQQPIPNVGSRPLLVVQGAIDRFGDAASIAAAVASSGSPNTRIAIIPRAEHLFPGQTQDVASAVVDALDWLTSASGTTPARPSRRP